MKNLKLKPSLREKRHYMLLAAETKKKLTNKDFHEKINQAILQFIGILGYAQAGPIFVSMRDKKIENILEEKNLVVLSVMTKYVDHVKSSLVLFKDNEDKTLKLKCIRVSGTIKKLKEFIENLE